MNATDAEPYREELQVHCYRMLGSRSEAEDAVQETMVRAWRAAEQFAGRSSFRNWLYRIATNVCLRAIGRRSSHGRTLPQLAGPSTTQPPDGEPGPEFLWLEPYPTDALERLVDASPGPHARYEAHEATTLAFVTAIQYLPPRQRAVLLLHDVLGWPAGETAETLETSVASVNSALQRARDTLRRRRPDDEAPAVAIAGHRERSLLDRYVRAWENRDLESLISVLKEDAVFSMPPRAEWYRGRSAIRGLLVWAWEAAGYANFRLESRRANGQPAFALYGRRAGGVLWHPHALQVLRAGEDGVAELTQFMSPAVLSSFELRDLPNRP